MYAHSHNLARSANTNRAIYFACVNFFFFKLEPNYLKIYWTDFHDLFTKIKGICVNFLDLDLFFYSFRDVAMATDFRQNLRNDLYSTCWNFATDSQFRFRGVKGHNFYYILCNFGEDQSTNPKDYAGSLFLGRDGKNRHTIPNISANTGLNFTNFSALVGSCMEIIKLK